MPPPMPWSRSCAICRCRCGDSRRESPPPKLRRLLCLPWSCGVSASMTSFTPSDRRAYPRWPGRFAIRIRRCGTTSLSHWMSWAVVGGTSPTAARSSTSARRCRRSSRHCRIPIPGSGPGLRRTSATWARRRHRRFLGCAPCCISRTLSREATPAEPWDSSAPRRRARCRTCARLSTTPVRRFDKRRATRSHGSSARPRSSLDIRGGDSPDCPTPEEQGGGYDERLRPNGPHLCARPCRRRMALMLVLVPRAGSAKPVLQ